MKQLILLITASFLISLAGYDISAAAETTPAVERTKNWEVGDKLTWNWVLNNKSKQLIEEVVAVTDAEISITYKTPERTYDAALSAKDMSYSKGICLANGQACTFSPPAVWVDFPLQKGKKWSGTTIVTGEQFKAEVAYEAQIEGLEKIKVAAGQFDTYKASTSGRIKATDLNGKSPSTGKESFTTWFAVISGKVVAVKSEYRNSYGEKFTRELVSAELK